MLHLKKVQQKTIVLFTAFLLLMTFVMPLWVVAASFTPGTYQGTGTGYGGSLTVSVSIDSSGAIESITVDANSETPGYLSNAEAIIPTIISQQSVNKVDAVAGATRSSNAIKEAVSDALSTAGTAVYLDGTAGDDGNPGTSSSPVKTFAQAKALLDSKAGIIYIMGTVTVDAEESWLLGDSEFCRVERASGFTGDLVSVSGTGELILEDIVLDGGSRKGLTSAGSLVFVASGGKLTIKDGAALQTNETSGDGGAVNSSGAVIMNDGSISENSADGTGGGLSFDGGSASFTMNGGSISGNSTAGNGGGVYSRFSLFTMTAGTIEKNSAAAGGGLCAWAAAATLSGGSITDNTATSNGGYFGFAGSLKISGNVKISGNTNESGVNSNVSNGISLSIKIPAAMGTEAQIGVTSSTVFATGDGYTLTAADAAKFFSDTAGYEVQLLEVENKLTIAEAVGGALLSEVYLDGVNGSNTNGGTSPSDALKTFGQAKARLKDDGVIYITDMVKVTGTESWTLSDKGTAKVMRHESYEGVEPAENDHQYINGPLVEVNGSGASLTLSNITLDGNRGEVFSVAGLITVKQGTLTMEDGTVLENEYCAQHNGAGVYVFKDGTFIMNGGTIRNNRSVGYGGGVFNGGRFDFLGGIITGNEAGYAAGGVMNSGTMNMKGAVTVKNNVLLVGGASTPSDLFFASGKYVTFIGALDTGAELNVDSYIKPANIARASGHTITEEDLAKFKLSDTSEQYTLVLSNNMINIQLTAAAATNAVYLDPTSGNDTNSGEDDSVAVKTLEKAIDLASPGDVIYVMNPITVSDSKSFSIADNSISLVRYFSHIEEMVRVESGGTLALSDITLDGAWDIGVSADKPLVMVDIGGKLTLEDGALLKNNSSYLEGGAVYNRGTIEMNGGTISGNNTQSGQGGGGIFNEIGSSLTMSGGVIENNTAFAGGGIESEGALLIEGGEIKNNVTRGGGAGVHVFAEGTGGTFRMTGGLITGNRSTGHNGGGLFVWAGDAYVSGGKITGNQAYSAGGGAYIVGNAYLSESAYISGNTDNDDNSSNLLVGFEVNEEVFTIPAKQNGAFTSNASIGLAGTDVLVTGSGYTITEEDAARYTSDISHRLYLDGSNNRIVVAETKVILSQTVLSLTVGGSRTLTASVSPADADQAILWNSADESIAGVSANGVVTAKKAGTTTITATDAKGESASCSVTISPSGNGGGVTSGAGSSAEVKKDTTLTPIATVSGSVATAAVTEKDASAALKVLADNGGSLVIQPKNTGTAATVITQIPATVLESLGKTDNANLKVETANGMVVLSNGTTASLGQSTGNVQISITSEADGSTSVQISDDAGKALEAGYMLQIPANENSAVAVLVHADGTEEVLPFSAIIDGMMHISLNEGATVKIENRVKVFDDTTGHWANGAIQFVSARSLFSGVTEEYFAPDQPITRAMIVTVFYRLAGTPSVTGAAGFEDVPDGAYFAYAVAWAKNAGLTSGVSETLFGADENITREQFAVFLYQFALQMGTDVNVSGGTAGFADAADISSWAKNAMAWATGTGIIQGSTSAGGEKLVNPAGNATRAEAATMLKRFIEYISAQ